MDQLAILAILWLLSTSTSTSAKTGPDAIDRNRAKGYTVVRIATQDQRNAGFPEEIHYADLGGSNAAYFVWPSSDPTSYVVVRVDAAGATTLLEKGAGAKISEVQTNALRINPQGNLLPLRMIGSR